MLTSHQLRQRRTGVMAELRQIAEGAEDALTDEQRGKVTELRSQADSLKTDIELAELLEAEQRAMPGRSVPGGADAQFEALAAQVTALDVIRAQMGGTDAACGRAREVSQHLEQRSGRTAQGLFFDMRLSGARPEQRVFTTAAPSGGPGSNLIQTDVSPNIIDRLRERIIVRRLGAMVLGGLVGNLSIPRLKASASAQWVAENSPITASDPQTDAVDLTPKHVGGIVEVSRNMIQQPSLDVTRLFESDLARIIAVALDQAALVGGGTNEPDGLLASGSGIGSISLGTAGAALTWNNVVDLIAAVDISNALEGSLAWATNGKAVAKMRKTLKTTGDTSSNFIMNDATTLAGYPLASTQNVPSNFTKSTGSNLSALIFGDWSQLVLGFWSELDLLVNPYESTAYAKGNVQIRAMATADVAIRQPLAFAAVTDMVTT